MLPVRRQPHSCTSLVSHTESISRAYAWRHYEHRCAWRNWDIFSVLGLICYCVEHGKISLSENRSSGTCLDLREYHHMIRVVVCVMQH